MPIAIGDRLPVATFRYMDDEGVHEFTTDQLFGGRKVAVFAGPGAYTNTCTNAHMPSMIAAVEPMKAKGVDEVLWFSVNDLQVLKSWSETTGAKTAGLSVYGDTDGSFTKAIGMDFDVPPLGFFGRTQRFSMFVEDGVVKTFNLEESRTSCDLSGGQTLLDQIG